MWWRHQSRWRVGQIFLKMFNLYKLFSNCTKFQYHSFFQVRRQNIKLETGFNNSRRRKSTINKKRHKILTITISITFPLKLITLACFFKIRPEKLTYNGFSLLREYSAETFLVFLLSIRICTSCFLCYHKIK